MRKKIFTWLCLGASIFLLTAFASQWIKPFERISFSLLGLTFPFIFIFSVVLLMLLLNRRNKAYYILLIAVLVSAASMKHFINISNQNIDAKPDLCVMSYNAMTGIKMVDHRYVMTSDIKKTFTEMIDLGPQPDIILLQEVNHVVEKILPSKSIYPYYHKLSRRGAAILSKHPILKEGVIDFGAKPNSCVWADIDLDGRSIRVYSVHLESNRLSEESVKIITKSEHDRSNLLTEVRKMINQYHKYASVRTQQAQQIKNHANLSPYPVIIAGDFNETPVSHTYHLLSKDMNDAWWDKGRGIGNTWIGLIPMLRIDYILSDHSMDILSYHRLDSKLSDHYPIKASYDLK